MGNTVLTLTDTGMQQTLLALLQQLLAIQGTQVKAALDQASSLISNTFQADKVDVFLHDPASDTLVAVGTSHTPLGQQQKATGLDRLPIANGGREVEVFQTGRPYLTGHAEADPGVVAGIRDTLGVRSMLEVPLVINDQRRGILSLTAQRPTAFAEEWVPVVVAIAQWVGLVTHRAELVERITLAAAEHARRGVAEDLITTLAHDLRNLLTPLATHIDLIRRVASLHQHAEELQQATQAATALQRIRALINDLLDVARLEHNLFTLDRQRVPLDTLVREAAALFQSDDTPIEARVADALWVYADSNRIRQALENLLANAIQFSPKGVPVTLEAARSTETAGEWAAIHVRDQGPGIAPEVLPDLFTRFRSGRESKGLGLGLYLAHGIATAHGGTLTVTSAPGAGADFCLSLPLCPAGEGE